MKKKIKQKIIGAVMVAFVLICIFIASAKTFGLIGSLAIWLISIILSVILTIGVILIFEDE